MLIDDDDASDANELGQGPGEPDESDSDNSDDIDPQVADAGSESEEEYGDMYRIIVHDNPYPARHGIQNISIFRI